MDVKLRIYKPIHRFYCIYFYYNVLRMHAGNAIIRISRGSLSMRGISEQAGEREREKHSDFQKQVSTIEQVQASR